MTEIESGQSFLEIQTELQPRGLPFLYHPNPRPPIAPRFNHQITQENISHENQIYYKRLNIKVAGTKINNTLKPRNMIGTIAARYTDRLDSRRLSFYYLTKYF